MYGNAFERIEQLVREQASIREGMNELFDLCAVTTPSPLWSRLRDKLDFESDFDSLTNWLRELLANEPPPPSINGLWFGLYNPILSDNKPSSCLYLAGSTRFEATDWHCGPAYWPAGRYSSSEVLFVIYRVANSINASIGAQAEYALCLGYSCLTISEWCRGPLRSTLLGGVPLRGVAAGFDSGDVLVIDTLRADS